VFSGRGLCDELITRPEESYRLCCVVVCNLETSRIGAPYICDISNLRVKRNFNFSGQIFEKSSNIRFMKVRPAGAELFHVDIRTDGQSDRKNELIVAFRNSALARERSCMYVCMYICIYLYVCTRMYVLCMYVRMYVCVYVCMYVCTYVCMYLYVCTRMYVLCMYVSMYVCMYICI
jgi:hypothetical protein